MDGTTQNSERDRAEPPVDGPRGGWFAPGEPQPPRGPFARWPRVADALLVVAVFVGSVIAVAASALPEGEQFRLGSIGDLPAGSFVLLGLAAAALTWRRAHPIVVTGFVLGGMVVWAVVGYGDGHDLALVVALYSVGRYVVDQRWSVAAVAAGGLVSLAVSLIDADQRIDIVPVVLLTLLPWYVGRRVRNRGDYLALLRERAERLEAEQHAEARQAVAAERARIARELHDVVAHRVSMMTVQAGAAKTIAGDDLDAAVEAMGDVERAGRQALGELRHLLGVLRPEVADSDDLGPQPGLAGIGALADELARTGARVHVDVDVESIPGDLPVAVDLSAYRIVQESLTNIVKHAGPEPAVDVTIGVDGNVLAIDIANTVDAESPGLPVSGYGVVGMRERAHLLDGTLVANRQADGRFRVVARLPLEPEAS